nr:AAA family ATPase [Actinomycetota bacterium]
MNETSYMTPTLRPYRPQDLGQILDLWQREEAAPRADGLSVDQKVDLLGSEDSVSFVAQADERVVGVALAVVSGVIAWIYSVSIDHDQDRCEDIARRLLEEVEVVLAEKGARKLAATAASDGILRNALKARGYEETKLELMHRDVSAAVATPAALAELGGRMIDPNLWDELKGMDDVKEIIERRVILPLAEPDLAARHSVSPPRAIVLFGPPGTGKTTFAKGIASRLEWPFIEVQPAELAGEGAERQAKLLAHAFDLVLELEAAVVFVDEVEDLASERDADRKVNTSVTNEFLKQIPRFREAPHHLLVCATNAIGGLDGAFLRPGRFDYVLPAGPPDAEARRAIWTRYVSEITDEDIDIDLLVEATELFTPADIEFSADKAAQRAFEREHFDESSGRATTREFLFAIKRTRPSLTEEAIETFRKETKTFARD